MDQLALAAREHPRDRVRARTTGGASTRGSRSKDPGGAYALELEAARPAITRWAQERFRRLRKQGGTVGRPRQIMEQILDTPTVNLITSPHREPRAARRRRRSTCRRRSSSTPRRSPTSSGSTPPPLFTVSGKIYAKCLEKFDVRLEDGQGFVQKGDTHFCFLVPERAFEDQVVLREAIRIGLVTKRLAACLLMVDPWNPVFSERRRALLRHVPATARGSRTARAASRRTMARAILAAAKSAPAGCAGGGVRRALGRRARSSSAPFNRILSRYYDAVEEKLKTQAGFDAYFQLAEERRRRFKETMPIARSSRCCCRSTNIRAARADACSPTAAWRTS